MSGSGLLKSIIDFNDCESNNTKLLPSTLISYSWKFRLEEDQAMALHKLLAVALMGSTLYTVARAWGSEPSPPPPSTGACDREFNTDCQCNCDCGDIYMPPSGCEGSCPDRSMVKCIVCQNVANNWKCDISGVEVECDEGQGHAYCLGGYGADGLFSRRCAAYDECPLPILEGMMVAGELADGIGCKPATCEVYGCKAFTNPVTGDDHCSVNALNGRQWVPAGKDLGLCACDEWCWEYYEPKRCDCCSDYFTFCAPYSTGYNSAYTNLDNIYNDDAQLEEFGISRLLIDSFQCNQTIAPLYGRYRDEQLTFINCLPINVEDSACDMATHVTSLPLSVIQQYRPDLLDDED